MTDRLTKAEREEARRQLEWTTGYFEAATIARKFLPRAFAEIDALEAERDVAVRRLREACIFISQVASASTAAWKQEIDAFLSKYPVTP